MATSEDGSDEAQTDSRPPAVRVVDGCDYAELVEHQPRTDMVRVEVTDDSKISVLSGNLDDWYLSAVDWENHTLTFRPSPTGEEGDD